MNNNIAQNLTLKDIKKLKRAMRIFKNHPNMPTGRYDEIIRTLEECIELSVEHFEKLRLIDREG